MDVVVLGKTVDDHTRGVHYRGPTDVIAIKFACCGHYYPCFQCHQECADHPAQQWPVGLWNQLAILCGVCQTEHTIETYLGAHCCPACGAEFNDGCRLHRHLYFATSDNITGVQQ
jgi:uncharacterized CHY-type Zn-finger protein